MYVTLPLISVDLSMLEAVGVATVTTAVAPTYPPAERWFSTALLIASFVVVASNT